MGTFSTFNIVEDNLKTQFVICMLKSWSFPNYFLVYNFVIRQAHFDIFSMLQP